MMSREEKMTSVSKWKVCYCESLNDIRSQYANRPSSPTAGILYNMLYWKYMIQDTKWHMLALWPVTTMLTTLLYCNFKSYCANTKLHLILTYRHVDCPQSIYQIAANSKYAFKQYTFMKWQLYMLLTSIVYLLNVVLSLDDRLPKYPWEREFCTLHLSKTQIYKPQNNVY